MSPTCDVGELPREEQFSYTDSGWPQAAVAIVTLSARASVPRQLDGACVHWYAM